MQSMLIVGIIVFTGFVFGELVAKIKLPKVTGYILAGILLNPGLFGFIPRNSVDHTSVAITSSIGGFLSTIQIPANLMVLGVVYSLSLVTCYLPSCRLVSPP